MSRRKSLFISTLITAAMALLCGIMLIVCTVVFKNSGDPDLAEGIGRALILIFGIISLIYLAIVLLFKLVAVLIQNTVLIVFTAIADAVGAGLLISIIISPMLEPPFEFTFLFLIDIIPFLTLIIIEAFAIFFDIKALLTRKKKPEFI